MRACILIALGITETHGMARSQDSEGVDGFQIWRGAANILNKQLETADRRRSSCFGVSGGADNSSEQNTSHSFEQPKQRKMYMRFAA
jgi:hypothetical protein